MTTPTGSAPASGIPPPPQVYANERDDPIYAPRENFKEKFFRRNRENPFVLPAVGLCMYSMFQMVRSGLRGDPRVFQTSQRLRVASQGLAIALATASVVMETENRNRLNRERLEARNA
ncbi:hypothetical protein HDU98_006463 [Podochytrium sp. JEL0797]|nr:hypothetical protein HDU98_006463 [Podochytrium sp. JEL0797]